MAGSFNRITIVGNLGRDPEMRNLPSGDTIADFSVATTERRRGSDGQLHDQTTWFRVSAFGKLAETACQYLRKGSYLYVDGTLVQRDYIDREGQQRQALEVRARELRMLDRKDDNAPAPALVGAGVAAGGAAVADVPF